MGRCCVCIYHAQVCYTLCRATALLFHPNPPSSSLLPPQPVPLPCRALQRGESSRRTVFCLPVPPDSVSLSLESAASFCPHCTSFRKERNEGRLTSYTSVISKYLLCTEILVFRQWHTSRRKVILKSMGWLQLTNQSHQEFAAQHTNVTHKAGTCILLSDFYS